ncbi:MAG: hypothetical protein C4576_33585 [Desulfobacteraceae bacterium]|nr:MAG: hypothetical protein C4576_33585 [Desulfobacteraceae bacterium]
MEPAWPELPWDAWEETCVTLHRWMQIVGKIRLKLAPMVNHWWQVPLYVTSRGLTTSAIPSGSRIFQVDFDFLSHRMEILVSDGQERSLPLVPRSVADFYKETLEAFKSLNVDVNIWTIPVEVEERTPFEMDVQHAQYDSNAVERFWMALVQIDRVMKFFRARFIGKASPVHFFWGAFDHAVTRFSGRRAPEHPGVPNVGRSVMVEAYSHEVSSCGFWPGAGLGQPAFYAYAYPEPPSFGDYRIDTPGAYYHDDLREFILPYEAVRTSADPDGMLLSFFQTTYEAAAELANWDRSTLERDYRMMEGEKVDVAFPPGPG